MARYTGETGFDRNDAHNLASATKSFVSALIGIAIDEGLIQSIDQQVFDFFPEHSDLLTSAPQKRDLTLKHLLTMTSGIDWDDETYSYFDSRNDMYQLFSSSDPIRYILAKDLVSTPGTAFDYENCNTNVLGEVVRQATDQRLDEFADEHLFSKLGITDFEWQMLPNDVVFCSGDLRLRPRDMAKFGHLFLSKGIWNGQRIISEKWIDESTREFISISAGYREAGYGWEDGYGYQWWLKRFHANNSAYESYFASGWGGQLIFVFPTVNMVVVFTGGNYFDAVPVDEILNRFILPALSSNH